MSEWLYVSVCVAGGGGMGRQDTAAHSVRKVRPQHKGVCRVGCHMQKQTADIRMACGRCGVPPSLHALTPFTPLPAPPPPSPLTFFAFCSFSTYLRSCNR